MPGLGKKIGNAFRKAQRGQPEGMTDLQWAVAKLAKEGKKPKEIAEKLNTSVESVHTALSRARAIDREVPAQQRGRPKDARPRIEELIDKDYKDVTIAKMLGKSQSNVGVQRKKINDAREPSKRKLSKYALYGTGAAAAGLGAGTARDD